ncbi:hypothetical protein AVEN_211117-1 [Araneus ventricosus]|uniref:Uncharacterized protein n=1 Tax=Araneus ventricosus TaxID=182803 RepID=A0A4Y2GTL4_ARAVE|nr:hypothetical protein AVEN_2787-1 [Araneus ventricosus]GBM56451.1 hypothetical protein AVEN_3671-1 [Araneus ventricosus]GBM56477.1 hypothetical protein AVEN_147879-1 [Araneus ventricosus]GBM56485.1 hypothetical protein AVEN_211117-1 [Araneus ventricosus]
MLSPNDKFTRQALPYCELSPFLCFPQERTTYEVLKASREERIRNRKKDHKHCPVLCITPRVRIVGAGMICRPHKLSRRKKQLRLATSNDDAGKEANAAVG